MHRRSKGLLLAAATAASIVAAALSPTNARAAVDCLRNPTGAAPNGRHWYSRTDQATGRKCWRLVDRISKTGRATTQLHAKPAVSGSEKPSKTLPRSTADARASVQDTVDKPNEPAVRSNSARSPVQAAEITYEDLLRSTFRSRSMGSLDAARPDDREPSLATGSRRRPTAPAVDRPEQTGVHVSTDGPSFSDILAVFLVSLGVACIFLGRFRRPFSFQRSSSVQVYPAPFSVPSYESDTRIARETDDLILETALERDRYGIPFITRASRGSLVRGLGSDKSAS